MRKLLAIISMLAAMALPAAADWTGKDATSATITFKNPGVCSSVVCTPVVQLYDGTNVVSLTTAGADAGSNTLTGVPVYSRNLIYNGATWDRWTGAVTLNAETTKVIGTVRNLGNAGAITDFAGQNAASPANAWLMGAQFNTTPTTITSGNASPLQLDSAGNLLVNVKTGSSGAVAQGSTTAGQTGGIVQGAVTTANPTYTTAQTNPLSLDTSGNLRGSVIPQAIATWGLAAATQNVSTPTNGSLVQGQFNTSPTTITSGNVSPLQLDSSGNMKVNIVAGASSGAVAQGSTTAGQTGSLIQGAVTTAAPTYTTAQTSPLSIDTGGSLRVNVTNTNANGQVATASSSPVTVAKNSGTGSTVAGAAVGTAGSASTEVVTVQGVASMTPILARPSDGTRNGNIDPCEANVQTYAPILMTTATTLQIIAPSASNKNYICSLFLNASAIDNVALVEGTGGSCVTGITGVIGGTTTGNGFNFIANGGVFLQAGGKVAVAQTAGTNVGTCLITSTTGPLIGSVRYVQAP